MPGLTGVKMLQVHRHVECGQDAQGMVERGYTRSMMVVGGNGCVPASAENV
ncbi:unnamed protein product, partial [marine sediment metagenome]